MDRANVFLNTRHYPQEQPNITRAPSPPAYYEETPPAYQAPAPKLKLLKRIKKLFTRKTKVHSLPPVYSSPQLPYQEPREYGDNLPVYKSRGGRKIRKTKRRHTKKGSKYS